MYEHDRKITFLPWLRQLYHLAGTLVNVCEPTPLQTSHPLPNPPRPAKHHGKPSILSLNRLRFITTVPAPRHSILTASLLTRLLYPPQMPLLSSDIPLQFTIPPPLLHVHRSPLPRKPIPQAAFSRPLRRGRLPQSAQQSPPSTQARISFFILPIPHHQHHAPNSILLPPHRRTAGLTCSIPLVSLVSTLPTFATSHRVLHSLRGEPLARPLSCPKVREGA